MGDNVSRSNEDDDVGSADGQLKDIVDLQVGLGEIREPFPVDIFKV